MSSVDASEEEAGELDARTVAGQFLEIIPLVMRMVAADLRGSDRSVRPAHFRLLGALGRRPRTLGELADMQAVSAPTMSNTITTLEGYGWVERRRSEEDRRVVRVQITEEGRSVLRRVRDHMLERTARVLEPLSPDERRRLVGGLGILKRMFERAAPRGDEP
ncbi:MAG TPA: MarR family transcriptional regulator [Gemmatimonadota bacterium]|nr:MarR family transcriptional regulator [Gemmatimonadota bacterium]